MGWEEERGAEKGDQLRDSEKCSEECNIKAKAIITPFHDCVES
jgi:hypothetical protein